MAEYLSKYNFLPSVATSFDVKRLSNKLNKVNIHQFKIKGSLVKGYSGEIIKYQNFLKNSNFDIIVFYAGQQWSFDLSLPIIQSIYAKKIFIPCGFSKLKNFFYIGYFFLLKTKLKYFNKLIFFSKQYQDYKFLKKFLKKNKTVIIPNCGEVAKIHKKINKKTTLNILNVSKFSYGKNQLELILASIFIKRSVNINFFYNNKNFYYKICYNVSKIVNFINKKTKFNFHYNIEHKTILNAYKKNDLFVFTSKIECSPLVIYDCVTNGLPFISKECGNVREIIKNSQIGKIYTSKKFLIEYINNFKVVNKKYKIAKKFFWDYQLKKYKKNFSSCLKN